MKINPHIVVRDAARATEWYKRVFDATEVRRIALPNGKLMAVALTIGQSSVHLADEFPELGVVSPLTVGGTSVTLTRSGASATASCGTRSATAGAWPSIYAMSRPPTSPAPPPRPSACSVTLSPHSQPSAGRWSAGAPGGR
jgi:hypothetical protein